MPDYKKMYLTLFQASEEAIGLLVKAQRECEELYISSTEPDIQVLSSSQPVLQHPAHHGPQQQEVPAQVEPHQQDDEGGQGAINQGVPG